MVKPKIVVRAGHKVILRGYDHGYDGEKIGWTSVVCLVEWLDIKLSFEG